VVGGGEARGVRRRRPGGRAICSVYQQVQIGDCSAMRDRGNTPAVCEDSPLCHGIQAMSRDTGTGSMLRAVVKPHCDRPARKLAQKVNQWA